MGLVEREGNFARLQPIKLFIYSNHVDAAVLGQHSPVMVMVVVVGMVVGELIIINWLCIVF